MAQRGRERVDSFIFLRGTRRGSIRKITSRVQTGKFKIVWLKLPFLGEVEIAVRLGVKSWFADVGLSRNDSILGLFCFLLFFCF